MSLSVGTRVGAYEVTGVLGTGGMGEVYRARDTKLDRDAALKILPEAVAADADRLVRFRREAKTLAALNHPHIAQIYGLEDASETLALAMELVEGEDLATRVRRGPVPIEEAIAIARQIAQALDAAHTAGIVHRDLKPGNVIVRADGVAKVLDFGLAKASEPAATGSPGLSQSPTITVSSPTEAGVILGTAAYMSPEQARGRAVDKRTDVWAFGCVLYELLCGRPAFDGETVTDVLGAIVRAEPDWSRLPAATPESVRRLLRRCLVKDRLKRLPDIAAAVLELDDAAAPANNVVSAPATTSHRWVSLVPWTVALGLAVVAAWPWVSSARGARQALIVAAPVQFTIDTAKDGVPPASIPQFAVSPDGRRIVLVGMSNGQTGLWLRDIDSTALTAIQDTRGAVAPFWSPDSQSVGFFAAGRLYTIAVDGGPKLDICAATSESRGGAWNRDGEIVFSDGTVLNRVRASGGTPRPVTALDRQSRETSHRYPQFLDDGRRIVYFISGGGLRKVAVTSLDDPTVTMLLEDTSRAAVDGQHLLYVRNGTLIAQGFDQSSLHLSAATAAIAQVNEVGQLGYAPFSAMGGSLAYIAGGDGDVKQLVWRDRTGKELGRLSEADSYLNATISPDGTRVLATIMGGKPLNRDAWIIDIARGIRTRITSNPASDMAGAWSPNGGRVAYTRSGVGAVFTASSAGGDERPVSSLPFTRGGSTSWSPDGRTVLVSAFLGAEGQAGIWAVSASGDREPTRYGSAAVSQTSGMFSPDGHWVAYQSDESGRREIYIGPYPWKDAKIGVSQAGGDEPRWRADGRELYFAALDGRLMAASITPVGDRLAVGTPVALFDVGLTRQGEGRYAVAPDGRFLVLTPTGTTPAVTVSLNWQASFAPGVRP